MRKEKINTIEELIKNDPLWVIKILYYFIKDRTSFTDSLF